MLTTVRQSVSASTVLSAHGERTAVSNALSLAETVGGNKNKASNDWTVSFMKIFLLVFLNCLFLTTKIKAQEVNQPFYFYYWNGECYQDPSCRLIIEVTDSVSSISKESNQMFLNIDSTLVKWYESTEVEFEKEPLPNGRLKMLVDSMKVQFERIEECCLDLQSATIVGKSNFCCQSEMQFSKGNSTLQIFHGFDNHLDTKLPIEFRSVNMLADEVIKLAYDYYRLKEKK